ncbi:RHS repeat-associated core domain-containing protein [Flagellimonas pacifica]|uniref:RHS repeat-associated core domain-containing protein n=1 Tax=Flagellimonas pacifica TaxID=1247520 RepID=A0A285N1M4_9FLAO|nr:RHS repeat-associated core domain-containing protein [Allomuricauda parva]SNZ01916.1 RHS repeat-associated core domain-containing protein [Allomuricauda parva]
MGIKLKKKVGATGPITEYAGNYIYQNGELQFFNTPEGYATPDGEGGYEYVYQYKDHLGNVRLSYMDNNGTLEIVEENNYYPFGLEHKGYNNITASLGNSTAQKFGYNGKELEESLGINWLEYGARNYDSSLGRFMNIDRFAEKYESITPYQYTFNSPIRFIDVNGDYVYINDGDKTYRYENGQTQHKVDGKWIAIDKNHKLSNYALGAIAKVDALSRSGETGKDLVDFFTGEGNDVTIAKGASNREVNGTVSLNLDQKSQLPTTDGVMDTPFYVTLGHELAHRRDKLGRGLEAAGATWYTEGDSRVTDSEIVATHIENQIRQESGLPLRTHYGMNLSIKGYKAIWSGDEKSRIIDKYGNSRYFGSNGKRVSPSPGIAKDVYGGEIYKNRFNYKNRTVNLKPRGIKF